jgi:hypothetical protein
MIPAITLATCGDNACNYDESADNCIYDCGTIYSLPYVFDYNANLFYTNSIEDKVTIITNIQKPQYFEIIPEQSKDNSNSWIQITNETVVNKNTTIPFKIVIPLSARDGEYDFTLLLQNPNITLHIPFTLYVQNNPTSVSIPFEFSTSLNRVQKYLLTSCFIVRGISICMFQVIGILAISAIIGFIILYARSKFPKRKQYV